jgi:phosphatidylserine decarboxylase
MKALSEGKWIFAAELALAVGLSIWWPPGAFLVVALLLFTLWFFRDPEPIVRPGADLILSPASGTVDLIEQTEEPIFRGDRSNRVSIFLSVFDIHTQRAPIAGTVKLIRYSRGQFANAIRPSAASGNENQVIGIEGDGIRVTVRQIAGLIARRICTWCKEGEQLAKGAPLGMIRFGSRVDIYLPASVEIVIKLGEHVRGGETILARRK